MGMCLPSRHPVPVPTAAELNRHWLHRSVYACLPGCPSLWAVAHWRMSKKPISQAAACHILLQS